ncbi:MAG: hypothetical protein U0232_31300 [Thermomicrobiales bacterium]
MTTTEGAAYGAALLAGVGARAPGRAWRAPATPLSGPALRPFQNERSAAAYAQTYALYSPGLYQALRETNTALSTLDNSATR